MKKNSLPNIFLIILDSARKDYFGCYGNTENITPNIDKLADDSLDCHNFFSGGSGTAQSHGCIFLGQHSTKSGLVHNLSEIKDNIYPFTALLKSNGYSNYGHSKIVVPPAGYEKLFSFDHVKQDKAKEVRYTRNKEFTDEVAEEFLNRKYKLDDRNFVYPELLNPIFG